MERCRRARGRLHNQSSIMPNKKKKKFNSRFPPTRIKRIMQTDEDVGKVAAAVPVIISPRALELFVESLIKNASQITRTRNAKTLTTTHLKQCILAENKFDFLKDLVASVPDVQGDDDSSNPPPTSVGDQAAVKGPANLIHKYKRVPRVRKFGRGNAGPSQLDDDEDDEEDDDDDDDEDEEDDDDDDDEDEDGSEDSLPATKAQPSFGSNHLSIISTSVMKTATTTTAPPPPNGTQPSVNAIASNVCNFAVARSASQLDEDYDS